MRFRVVINDVEIVRDWPWSKISNVKERLKSMGFRWDGEKWVGRALSTSSALKLKEILELSEHEVRMVLNNIIVHSEGGAIGIEVADESMLSETLRDCIMDRCDDVVIISVPCYIRSFIRKDSKYLNRSSSLEEYIRYAVDELRNELAKYPVVGDLEEALSKGVRYCVESTRLRELYERRVKWWTALVGLNYVDLNFVRKGLLKDLLGLTIPYYRVDKDGVKYEERVRLIRREDVVKLSDGRWRVTYPVFVRDEVIRLLRSYGYVVKEVEAKPRRVSIPKDEVRLYEFQQSALKRWIDAGCRGTIVIPTGGGKTFIGLKAIKELSVSTIVLVTTEELLNQWYSRISKYLGYVPGRLSGKHDEIKDVVVSTYSTAVRRINEIQNTFSLVIADECLLSDTLIAFKSGKAMTIEDVVENGVIDELLIGGRVLHTMKRKVDKIVRIKAGASEICTTLTHPHVVYEDGSIVVLPAFMLRRGQHLLIPCGSETQMDGEIIADKRVNVAGLSLCPVQIESVRFVQGSFVTYDLTTETSLFVANNFLTHNCHHVPAKTFKEVLFKLSSPYRLALSATPTRSDSNEHLIFLSCGPIVYEITYRDLISYNLVVPIRHYRIHVRLSDSEREEYERAESVLKKKMIALRASEKIDVVYRIASLEHELGSKILVFTQYIQQAEEIFSRLRESMRDVALITSETQDRDAIFREFSRGSIRVLVTTTVLDEGIDVPDADVAIIASGTGSRRQMIQRIGRVIRWQANKRESRVYEIVAKNTIEDALSRSRHPEQEIEEIECRSISSAMLDKLLRLVRQRLSSGP